MTEKPLPAVEFERLMKPADALARLPADWSIGTKRDAIMRRLGDGSIPAIAKSCVIRDRDGSRRYDFAVLEPRMWAEPWNASGRDFWQLGDVSFDDLPPPQLVYVFSLDDPPEGERPVVIASFKDVRIDPDSFAREFAGYLAADDAQDKAGEIGPPRGTPIAAAEMERFVRLYLDLWGEGAREIKALEAIRAAYPGSSIGRDVFLAKFRELRGPGKVGKPSKNNR